MLIEELSLVLVHHGAVLLPKLLEGLLGIIVCVLLLVQIIVMGPLVPVGENVIGFADLVELLFGLFPVVLVLVWVPLSR